MQGSNSTTKTDRSPEYVWETVVQVTNRVGTDEAKAIRVLLYLALLTPGGSTFRDRLRSRVNFLRRVALPKGRTLAPAAKGKPLFAFLYDSPANTNNLLPVFEAARKRGWQPTVLSGHRVDLEAKGLSNHAPLVGINELMALIAAKEWLAALTGARKHYKAIAEEFERQGLPWAAEVKRDSVAIIHELALAMVATCGLRRLYSEWEPSFVISTANLWPFDCAVYDEARRLGIPSFIIQHGVTNHYWWPFAASKMLLWGKRFENELIEFGAGADQLSVCGMPAADPIFSRHQHSAASQTSKSASSMVVLSHTHARATNPQLYEKFHALFQAIVIATPSIQWSVKLHPNEDDSFYRSLLNRRPTNFRVLPKSMPLEEAVTGADLACTLYSTSGFEAMMMRRPLVVFDLDPIIHEYAWWPKFGGGIYVNNLETMLDFAGKASSNPLYLADLVTRQDWFLEQNFANHGRAADCMLDTVEEVVRGRT